MDWCHYVELAPIIHRTCHEFGVPVRSAPSLWAAVSGHLEHISALNDRPLEMPGSPTAHEGNTETSTTQCKQTARSAPTLVTPQNLNGLAFLDQLASFHYDSIFLQ